MERYDVVMACGHINRLYLIREDDVVYVPIDKAAALKRAAERRCCGRSGQE